ncbi:TetR/AcrR family transcriptional regulator [Marinobacterium sedimentorum]|uniref:TetR/AcrR family transcriptional regulator n=1 Tax=Marinobacterium sedimentorum TaxID=2927804 RepID=UPI0020C72A26|nr:TetR/AcrR family transcriptional regulator [Marinobacterium sedimentorum]MCP8690484.1 TetR/AcrR family transcriptional regulator [Marinobacterium sedimentorum]
MARVQFDREQVIQDCTQLFWQQGFSGASMQKVVQATGLKPGSLYLAFGSKEGLYQAALEHYARQSQATLSQALENAPSVGEGICQQLLRMIEAAEKADYCSCFLVKSQLELAASGGDLHRRVCAYITEIEDLYVEYLQRDYPQDQARQYATSLMMHVFGIRVYGYLERDRDRLLAAVKSGLPWLPWDACEQEALQ